MIDNATVTQDYSGIVRVYYNDPGPSPSRLYEYFLDGNGWHVSTGSCAVCGQRYLSGTPTALTQSNGNVSVFYRDAGDGGLHESYLTSFWFDHKLSSAADGIYGADAYCPAIPPHPPSASVDDNIRTVNGKGLDWFYNQVRTGGPWDYKNVYNDHLYDDFGNFNYGAAGLNLDPGNPAYDDTFFLEAAGLAENPSNPEWFQGSLIPPYGDDPQNQFWIQQGMLYYERGCYKH
jgi:hypothetical protein